MQSSHFCINPVDSREAEEKKPKTLVTEFEVPEDIKSFDGFSEASRRRAEGSLRYTESGYDL